MLIDLGHSRPSKISYTCSSNFNLFNKIQKIYFFTIALYYRDAKAAIVVYDITNKKSFDTVITWVKEVKSYGPKNISNFLNKINKIRIFQYSFSNRWKQMWFGRTFGSVIRRCIEIS